MEHKKITAIIRNVALQAAEEELKKLGVHMSVSHVKGHGEFKKYVNPWESETHARIEMLVESARVEQIVTAIMDAASSGVAGDGIIAVLPVERVYRIRTKTLAGPGEI